MDHASLPIFVALTSVDDEACLRVQRGSERRSWRWGKRSQKLGEMQKFLRWAGDGPLVCYRGRDLTDLLSHTRLLSRTRKLLGTMTDLFEGALIAAADAPEYGLAELAAHLVVPQAEDEVDVLPALRDTLCERFAALPRGLLILLDYLRGDRAHLSWLPWPDFETLERQAPLAHLARLMPEVEQPKRAGAEGEAEPLPSLMRELFSPDGALAHAHPAYEERPAQIEMAYSVAQTLQDGGVLVVEAGTGVGKSLAYLAPAILWARRHGQPVVVSTNTRNLQEQLLTSDLPLLARALPVSFRAALLKGRGNYPCLRSLSWLITDTASSLFWSERLALMHFVAWLAAQPVGDLEALSPEALAALDALSMTVDRVRSQGESCLGRACSFNKACTVERARESARAADVVIVNHALIFADAQGAVLPEYSHLIFDEAQNIEAVATEGLSSELSGPVLNSFARLGGVEGRAGVLEMIRKRLQGLVGVPDVRDTLALLPQMSEAIAELMGAGEALGEELIALFSALPDQRSDAGRASLRLTRQVREAEEFGGVARAGGDFIIEARGCHKALEALADALAAIEENAGPDAQGVGAEAAALAARLDKIRQAAEVILGSTGDEEDCVMWAEVWERRGGPGWALRAAPIEVGALLEALFYKQKQAIIFTSATLSVGGEFGHFKRRLGLNLEPHRIREESFPSPFDLERQLLLCVPTDLPDPREPAFNDVVQEAIGQICAVAQGGTLALFTARSRMEQAFAALAPELAEQGLRPLCQDLSGPRWWLLDQLRQHDNTVLFGLKSFWEGVDVPGSALRCVILAKLPFAVPDDPIVEARQEHVKRLGGNPISDYYIPEAIVGFKQGVGRLIRTRTDRGVVFVLDPRLWTRSYGRRFFRSIQRCALGRDTLENCLAQAQRWLQDEPPA